ncbi:MAG TPA: cytochrome c oxidase subunit 3 [Acidobacteriaceae bacterium]|jgi:cytochrome c oxidase subunit 3|nr:cytochrome c oxidase subunit 3 [Acidobacteriaceae bacterium]
MPTILTPPGIRKPRRPGAPDHIGEGDHGSGRRPPTDKRTGGNGDGDNWSDRPPGRRGPRERLSRARIGLFFALGGDLMFFVALVSVFFVAKTSGHFDAYSRYINDWLPTSIPTILWLNTAVLLVSSVAAENARRSMFREQDLMDEWIGLGRPISRRAAVWLASTLALGGLFLAGQWIAWDQLSAQHVFFNSNASSHFFYLITIAHAIHLFLGIGALVAALIILARSRQLASRQVFVDATVWYWHAMGLLWIFLFVLLEFCQ